MESGPESRQEKWTISKTEAILRLTSYYPALEDSISWWGLERGVWDFMILLSSFPH